MLSFEKNHYLAFLSLVFH